MALVVVANGIYFVDGAEVAADEGHAERFAGLDRSASAFFDENRNPRSLVALRLVDGGRFERYARQPRALFTGLQVAQVVDADETRWHFVRIAAVIELFIRREVVKKLAGCQTQPLMAAEVTEVNLAERLAVFVMERPRHVGAEEHRIGIVSTVDSVHRKKYRFPLGNTNTCVKDGPNLRPGATY